MQHPTPLHLIFPAFLDSPPHSRYIDADRLLAESSPLALGKKLMPTKLRGDEMVIHAFFVSIV